MACQQRSPIVTYKKSGGLFFNSGESFQVKKKKREKHNLTLTDMKGSLLLTSMT